MKCSYYFEFYIIYLSKRVAVVTKLSGMEIMSIIFFEAAFLSQNEEYLYCRHQMFHHKILQILLEIRIFKY